VSGPQPIANWLHRALLLGFYHPAQRALTEPYVARYFDVVDQIWAIRDSEVAQEFVEMAYPSIHVSQATIDATEAWLADPDKPAPLRRLIAEGRDGVVRAGKGRARDAAEN